MGYSSTDASLERTSVLTIVALVYCLGLSRTGDDVTEQDWRLPKLSECIKVTHRKCPVH